MVVDAVQSHVPYVSRRLLTNYTNYTVCPIGFVIPQDPDHHEVDWVENTNCAVGCKSPIFDPDSWENANTIASQVNIIGMCCLTFLITSHLLNAKEVSKSIWISTIYSAIPTFVDFVQFRRTFHERFCIDNAVPITSSSGMTGCTIQSFVSIMCGIGLVTSWALHSFQIFMMIIGFKNRTGGGNRETNISKSHESMLFGVIILVPLIITIVVFSIGVQGYSDTPGDK